MSTLPEGWARTTLGDVHTINPRHPKDVDKKQTISFVPMPAVSEETGSINDPEQRVLEEVWTGYTHFRNGDVLFAKITPCMENGKIAVANDLTNGLGCGTTEFHVLRSIGATEPKLVWYYLRDYSFRANAERSMTGAVGQRRVPKSYLEEHSFLLPPLAEQRRIVEKLDALNANSRAAAAALTRIETLITRYKAAVLASAVRGRMTNDWREANDVLTVSERLTGYTPPEQPRGGREASDTILDGVGGLALNIPERALPKGWEWVSLNHLARQETGHTPSRSKSQYWDGGIPWIGIKDARLHHGREIFETLQTVTQLGLDNSASRLLPKGTVCLSRTASVGYVFIMGRDMATSQDFVTWTCGELLLPKYLMYALMGEGDEIRRFGKGTTHTTIYFPEVRAMHIALPPLEEQAEIVTRIEAAFSQIETLSRAAAAARVRLSALDRAILARAFKGKLVPQNPNDEPASELLKRVKVIAR